MMIRSQIIKKKEEEKELVQNVKECSSEKQ